jgi:hypothetical protein
MAAIIAEKTLTGTAVSTLTLGVSWAGHDKGRRDDEIPRFTSVGWRHGGCCVTHGMYPGRSG